MIKFDVTNRWSGEVQFTAEIHCTEDAPRSTKLGLVAKWAVKTGADLRKADLQWADLREADLHGADLWGADLRNADLWGADLWGADLRGADLREADLRRANLWGANLWEADLRNADLHGADLWGANLRGANLRGANLRGAKNLPIITFGPVGLERRTGCVRMVDDKPVIKLGCFSGDLPAAIKAITAKYGPNSSYQAVVEAAHAELLEQNSITEKEAA